MYIRIYFQNHQSQLEIFDGNVAHVSTWLYQAEALLDEIEKKPVNKSEETVKVSMPKMAFVIYTVFLRAQNLAFHINTVLFYFLFLNFNFSERCRGDTSHLGRI